MNKNIWLLALAQGFYLTNNVTFIAINGLVGFSLTPIPWLSTLPVMAYVFGSALSTPIVAAVQKRLGRRRSFQIAIVIVFFASLLCALAVIKSSFWLLNLGTLFAGFYNANALLYRFVAAELVEANQKEKAVSWVLAGGVLGAVAGPNLASHTKFLFSEPFVGAYISLACIAIVAWMVISLITFPPNKQLEFQGAERSIFTIMRQPIFIICASTVAFSYGVMSLLMAATPLAMDVCGLTFQQTAIVLEWHVLGMFAPGFFTGYLIKRFGSLTVICFGVVLYASCIFIAILGQSFNNFLGALILLGIGWNFLFTSSTTLALSAYKPQERDKVQGAINFFVFTFTAISALSSGVLITTQGWNLLAKGSIVPLMLIFSSTIWLYFYRKKSDYVVSL